MYLIALSSSRRLAQHLFLCDEIAICTETHTLIGAALPSCFCYINYGLCYCELMHNIDLDNNEIKIEQHKTIILKLVQIASALCMCTCTYNVNIL